MKRFVNRLADLIARKKERHCDVVSGKASEDEVFNVVNYFYYSTWAQRKEDGQQT